MTGPRVLLADSDDQHRHLLQLAIHRHWPDATVIPVATQTAFRNALTQDRYHCLVLDYQFGPITAPQLLQDAAQLLRGCPCVTVSSSSRQEVVIDSIRAGAVDFVPKARAVEGDELGRRLEQAIHHDRRQRNDRRRLHRRLRSLAWVSQTDPLTGLANRRLIARGLSTGHGKSTGRPAGRACVMIDIDHFKTVNDTHGHAMGDRVLESVARTIQRSVDSHDTAVRYGGEEFLVVTTWPTMTQTWLWAERLRRRIQAQTIHVGSTTVGVTVSMGLAPGMGGTVDHDVIDRADRAMYLAKQLGRNAVCTVDMVDLLDALRSISIMNLSDPYSRREEFLRRCRHQLGATQWQHITNHAQRVCDQAGEIAMRMGLDPQVVEQVRLAGLFHDIGKCMIPEDLLAQPRGLSVEEWTLVARHARLGAWIADLLGVDSATAAMIHHHHTRYDSHDATTGQPHPAPLGARLICVADALVTMTSNRAYRSDCSVDEAILKLQQQRGRQFDPVVVDAVKSLDRPDVVRKIAA